MISPDFRSTRAITSDCIFTIALRKAEPPAGCLQLLLALFLISLLRRARFFHFDGVNKMNRETMVLLAAMLLAGCDDSRQSMDVEPGRSAGEMSQQGTAPSGTAPGTTSTTSTTATPVNPPAQRETQPATSPDAGMSPQATSGDSSQVDRLYGTWVAENVNTDSGDVRIRLTFREDGPVKIAAWSELPLIGQVRDKTAPFEVHGNTITSDAIRGGTTVHYRFDQGDLIIEDEDGKTVRFTRQQP